MKKNKLAKILGIFLLIGGLASCEDEKPSYPPLAQKPIVSLSQTSYSGAEGQPVTITLNLDRANARPIDLKLEFVDDEQFEDLEFVGANLGNEDLGWGDLPAYSVQIPANVTTYSFTVTLPDNGTFDADRVYTMRLTPAGNLNGEFAEGTETIFTVTFTNTVSDVLSLTFDWDQTFTFSGTDYTLCEIDYDNDILVFENGTPIVYANAINAAATADCPEHLDFNFADYADGVYHIYQNVWDNGGLAGIVSPPFEVPVRVHYTRGGSQTLNGTYTQAPQHSVDSDFPSDPNGTDLKYIVTLTILNGTYTLSDDAGVIVTGRTAQANGGVKKAQKTWAGRK